MVKKHFQVAFSAGENGSVTASVEGGGETTESPLTVEKGKIVTFIAKANDGYEVNEWSISGGSFEASTGTNGNTIAKVRVNENVNVTVSFKTKGIEPKKFKVTFGVKGNAGKSTIKAKVLNGNAIVSNNEVKQGETVEFEAIPDVANGYSVKKWTIVKTTGGTALSFIAGTGLDGSKTARAIINEDVTVEVEFKIITYSVAFSAGENGSITANVEGGEETTESPLTVEKGKIVSFSAKANDGYEVNEWSISGGSFEASTGTNGNTTAKVRVGENVNVTVSFKVQADLPARKSFTVNGVTFNMRVIKATEAKLGSSEVADNKPHTVKLSEYCIGETEVTQCLWEAVMGKNPSHFSSDPAFGERQSMRPVENVSWYDCIAFCNDLTKKVNNGSDAKCIYYSDPACSEPYTKEDAKKNAQCYIPPSFALGGFRLPTEAEWEWAAKGGSSYKYCGTNDVVSLIEYAWYRVNSSSMTHEVQKKKMNGYGLYDMNGNVWEWCYDWYGESIPANTTNYKGANFGEYRILRGGCWTTDPQQSEIANRDYGYPDTNDGKDTGLRLVCK